MLDATASAALVASGTATSWIVAGADRSRRCSAACTRPTAWPASPPPTNTCTPSTRATWRATGRPGESVVARRPGRGRPLGGRRVGRRCRSCCRGTRSRSVAPCRRCSTRCASRRRSCWADRSGLTRVGRGRRRAAAHGRPEFQELAWRFWTDSQATFSEPGVPVRAGRLHPSPVVRRAAARRCVCLGLLLLTKESAAVTFTPVPGPGGRHPAQSAPDALGGACTLRAGSGLLVLAVIGLGVLLARAPGDLARNALLQKTFGAGPLILSSIRDAIPRDPELLAAAGDADRADRAGHWLPVGDAGRLGLADRSERGRRSSTQRPTLEPVGAGLDPGDAGVAAGDGHPLARPCLAARIRSVDRRRGGGAAGGCRHRGAVPAQLAATGLGPGAARVWWFWQCSPSAWSSRSHPWSATPR